MKPKLTKFDFSHDHITGAVLLDTRRIKENNLYPVTYRITFNRKQVRYKSGNDLSEAEWNKIETTKQKDLTEKREEIKAGINKIEDEIKTMLKEGIIFSFEELNLRLSRGSSNKIIDAFDKKVASLIKQDRIGTAQFYITAGKSIETYAGKNLRFSEITPSWLKKYETWMLKSGNKYSTIGIYLRGLRSIINEGIKNRIISTQQYPFGSNKYIIPQEAGSKKALTIKQIDRLLSEPLNSDTEKKCRDLWYFSYLCNGANINDILRLRYSDIQDGEISWYRKKTINTNQTKKKITAILLPEMQEIINMWGNDLGEYQYVFPFLYEGVTPVDEKRIVKNAVRLINKKMNKLGKALEFGPITTYTARHSYSTVLKRSGANIAYISESLGHNDIRTTETYLSSFEKSEREKNAAMLTKFHK